MESVVGFGIVIVVLIVSVIFHEVAHGLVALWFGDDTAKRAGRLTLNPISHIDPFGSILLPALMFFLGGFIFAWAKPVPVNFNVLRPRKIGIICVSLAGIFTNFVLAVLAASTVRIIGIDNEIIPADFLVLVVYLNVLLGIFNLFPIPPLDGSRILTMWLPQNLALAIERLGMLGFIVLIILLPYLPIGALIKTVAGLLIGT